MMNPTYRIFYGKYPDECTNEFPTAHIKQMDGLTFKMEAGKPAEPQVDSLSFTLANLDGDGAERYPDSWFEGIARTQAEGGLFPQQIFFKILIVGSGAFFLGVFDSKKYSAYRDEVTISIKSMLSLVKDKNLTMLNEVNLGTMEFYDPLHNFGGADLDGSNIHAQQLVCSTIADPDGKQRLIEALGYDDINQIPISTLDGNTQPSNPVYSGPAYLKVLDITLLLTIQIYRENQPAADAAYLNIQFWHMNNDNLTVNNAVILQRGRFFRDDKGNKLKPLGYDCTLWLPNVNSASENVMIQESDMPDSFFIGGIKCSEPSFSSNSFIVQESDAEADFFDLFEFTMQRLNSNLYAKYYNGSVPALKSDFTRNLNAFWSDITMFGWQGQNTSDVMVNLATAVNCYLFVNEAGEITFQDRLKHESYLPDSAPPGAFEVDLADIKPLGSQDNSFGFDSFKVTTHDRIPVNNVEGEKEITINVDKQGQRKKPSLRSTDLTIKIYRTDNLGIPAESNGLPLLRRSPDDTGFVSGYDLSNFINKPVSQAQQFAKSLSYPLTLWSIQWDMDKYPDAGIGGYFWVAWPSENRVYLIRQITHDPQRNLHKMEVQQVGEYTP